MCDNSVTADELEDWVLEHANINDTAGCSDGPISECDPTPCLYVYSTDEYDKDTVEGCRANVCSDSPNTNDMLKTKHGAWSSIEPILNGDLVGHELLEVESDGVETMQPHPLDYPADPGFTVAP